MTQDSKVMIFRHVGGVTTDLHDTGWESDDFSSHRRGHNWPFRCLDVWRVIGKSRDFVQKIPQNVFWAKKSTPSRFERSFWPNWWNQVNLMGTPEKLGIIRGLLAKSKNVGHLLSLCHFEGYCYLIKRSWNRQFEIGTFLLKVTIYYGNVLAEAVTQKT